MNQGKSYILIKMEYFLYKVINLILMIINF